ncbi:MAG TPA: DUF5050 domain-containing protein [Pyrinomonadaceae bacterium]|nr:DUF5050 domain-containing protein [Pyrinomonadaceae bacterium]
MESVILGIFLMVSSLCVNASSTAGLTQKFLLPQDCGGPVLTPTPTPTPTAARSEHGDEAPADAVFYQTISWSPDDSRILFSALQNGKWNIYVMRADGAQVTKLMNNPDINYFNPSWSPNGKQIVFSARQAKPAKSDIFVMNADGTGVRQLTTDAANDSSPAWSPNGKQIAFISDRDGGEHDLQVYLMRADGSEQRRLVKSATHDYDPQWSPDGKRIVYYAEKGDRKDQVWIVNADGSNPTLVTGGEGHNIFPAWTPDGSIVFASQRTGPEENMTMYTVKTDGSGLKRLSEQQAFLARMAHDGMRVAFLAGQYPRNAMYVENVDGSGLKKLTP